MVYISSLLLPILLSAVLVFVVSSIIHMMLGYHKSDYKQLPSESEVMEALRKFNIPPGDYMMPRPTSAKAMKERAFQEKWAKGPLGVITIFKPGPPAMGAQLIQWFLYSALIGLFSAYVASRTLAPGAPYLAVFRITGTVAFAAYSLALLQHSIWYKRSWGATLRSVFDGLVYACLTGGAFGWLWPR